RLAKRGCNLRFVPAAKVYHPHPATLRAYARRKFNIGRWKVLVHVRHPERIISDSHTPPSLKVQLLLLWCMLLLLGLWPFQPTMLGLCVILLAAFLASGIPFIVKAASKDRQVAVLAPFMLLARAASLDAGLL